MNDYDCRIGLHIGLPKTGTTSLQALCFEQHPGIKYFGQTSIGTHETKTILQAILSPDDAISRRNDAVKHVAKGLKEKDAVVISDEGISLGEFMRRAEQWKIVSDHRVVAHRARSILGQAQILIVLRNQVDWLISWHRQGLKTGYYIEANFDHWLAREIAPFKVRLFDALRYDILYTSYADAFGKDNVHVYLYENHREDLSYIASEYCKSLKVDPGIAKKLMSEEARNVTGKYYSNVPPILRRMVRSKAVKNFVSMSPLWLRGMIVSRLSVEKPYEEVSDASKNDILAVFSESNMRLFSMLGINGSSSGYY